MSENPFLAEQHPLVQLAHRARQGELDLSRAIEEASSPEIATTVDEETLSALNDHVARLALEDLPMAYILACLDDAVASRVAGPLLQAHCALQRGTRALDTGQVDRALQSYRRALELYRQVGDPLGETHALQGIGDVERCRDEHDRALQSYEQTLGRYRELGDRLGEGRALWAIGEIQRLRGQWDRALESYEQALELFRTVGDQRREARALQGISQVQVQRGDHPLVALGMRVIGGELTLEQALEGVSSQDFLERLDDRAIDSSDDLVIQISERQPQVALVFARLNYAAAIRLRADHRLVDDRLEGHCAGSLANASNRLGRFSEALSLYAEARKVFQQNGMEVSVARCDLNMAGVYRHLNQFERALSLYGEALRAGAHIPEITWKCRWGLGRVHKEQDRPRAAYRHLGYAIRTLETLRGALPREQVISSFFEDKTGLYREMVATCLRFQRADRALEYVERSKSRNLLELLARQDLQPQESVPRGLVDDYRRLRLKRRELQYRLTREQGSEALARTKAEIEKAEAEYDRTLKDIRAHDEDFTAAVQVEPIPSDQIQELLPDPETALVEFFMTGEQLLAFVVTQGAISHKVIEGFTPGDLADQWKRWIEGYQRFRDYGDRRAWLQTLDEVLKELYDKIFLQVKEAIPNSIKKLILIPYQYLHFFPLHALYREEGGQRRYLLEEYEEISYAPSASLLKRCKGRGKRGREKLFAVSDPDGTLEHSREEVEAIQAWFEEKRILGNPPPGKKISYDPATVERCLAESPEYHVLHFACHGQYDFLNPLRSHLRLSDGELTLGEILACLYLPQAWLVVLSACETGIARLSLAGEWVVDSSFFRLSSDGELTLGEILARLHFPQAWLVVLNADETGITELSWADEWVGLASGFLQAGAPMVISSLWSVEDRATSLLMRQIYDNLLGKGGRDGGMSVAQALNEAQRAFLRGEITRASVEGQEKFGTTVAPYTVPVERDEKALEDYCHPFYWAAFTASGAG